MPHRFILTSRAERELKKLDPKIRFSVERKLKQFLSASNPLDFAESVVNLPPATHRFRVWKLRIKFFCEKETFVITSVGRRDKVYRK